MSDLESRLAELPSEYEPIIALAREFASYGIGDEGDDVLLAGHEPERGRLAYAVTLFPGLSADSIEAYGVNHNVSFPPVFKRFLQHLNGAFLCELSIFGIPPSMLLDPSRLSRSNRNPYDIGTANNFWIAEYKYESPPGFHFGSRNVSWSHQIGYFLRSDGSVVSLSKDGSDFLRRTWPAFDVWLEEELAVTLRDRPQYLSEVQQESRKAGRRHMLRRLLPWNWHRWWNS